jgi:hypothetical protein
MTIEDLDRFDTSDLGPGAVAEALAKLLADTLENTGLIEIKEIQVAVNQIHMLGAVKPENEKDYVDNCGFPMEERAEHLGMINFGKSYFRKKGARKYGWHLSLASDDLIAMVREACLALTDYSESDGPREPHFPESVPILGAAPESSGSTGGGGRRGVALVRG